jgi:hypothetical protein
MSAFCSLILEFEIVERVLRRRLLRNRTLVKHCDPADIGAAAGMVALKEEQVA